VTFLPPTSSLALKEWAVAINALKNGDQVMILRKGGIHREDKDFRIVHPEFLLFPTYEHQAADLLKPMARPQLTASIAEDDIPGLVTISWWVEATDVFELRDEDTLSRLSSFHIWDDGYAQKRLHWRPKHPLTVALLRVYTLQQPQALPVLEEYLGCKSWVDLGQEVPLGFMEPVLDEMDYRSRVQAISETLGASPSKPT